MENGIGNIATWNQDFIAQALLGSLNITWFPRLVDNLIANQVADVRYHPILAGFNEPVLVQLGNVSFDDHYLPGNDTQQCLQYEVLFCITLAIDRR